MVSHQPCFLAFHVSVICRMEVWLAQAYFIRFHHIYCHTYKTHKSQIALPQRMSLNLCTSPTHGSTVIALGSHIYRPFLTKFQVSVIPLQNVGSLILHPHSLCINRLLSHLHVYESRPERRAAGCSKSYH